MYKAGVNWILYERVCRIGEFVCRVRMGPGYVVLLTVTHNQKHSLICQSGSHGSRRYSIIMWVLLKSTHDQKSRSEEVANVAGVIKYFTRGSLAGLGVQSRRYSYTIKCYSKALMTKARDPRRSPICSAIQYISSFSLQVIYTFPAIVHSAHRVSFYSKFSGY